jgi:hypothetical protein
MAWPPAKPPPLAEASTGAISAIARMASKPVAIRIIIARFLRIALLLQAAQVLDLRHADMDRRDILSSMALGLENGKRPCAESPVLYRLK